jgi:N-acetylneuraminic acid mutarotase
VSDESQVRTLLVAAAEPPGGPLVAPVPELLSRAHAQRRRRRGLLVAAAVAATALVIVIPTVLVGGSGRSGAPAAHRTTGPAPATAYPSTGPGSVAALVRDHWSQLPTAPIPGRTGAAAVWTGQQMLVWGGGSGSQSEELRSDGAAYDPATNRWSMLPAGPLSGRTEMASVWTGQDMFIWGGYDNDSPGSFHATDTGALYDPSTRTWRQLPPSPLSARVDATALWTGTEVVVIGGQPAVTTSQLSGYTDAAAYNPRTNTWRRLAPTPVTPGPQVEYLEAIAASNRIYVWLAWDHFLKHHGHTTGERFGLEMVSYDAATNRWSMIPQSTSSPRGVNDPQWTGSEVVMPPAAPVCGFSCPVAIDVPGARFNPQTKRWTPIAASPDGEVDGLSFWTGEALLTFNPDTYMSGGDKTTLYPGATAAWDPNRNRWTKLANAPFAGDSQNYAAVWTGSELLMWGEMSAARDVDNGHRQALTTVGLSFGG